MERCNDTITPYPDSKYTCSTHMCGLLLLKNLFQCLVRANVTPPSESYSSINTYPTALPNPNPPTQEARPTVTQGPAQVLVPSVRMLPVQQHTEGWEWTTQGTLQART